jgi:branched-chain amino acid transport system substrate-binding protein
MKKVGIIIGIIVVVLVFVFTLTLTKKAPKPPKEIKIGAILPLTGPASYMGEGLQKGMELAKEEINQKQLGFKLNIIYEDSKGEPQTGVSAYMKLKTQDKVQVIVAALSTVVHPLIPLVDKDKIPLIATVVSEKGIGGINPWVFRFFTKAEDDARDMAEYVYKNLGIKKVAIIYVQDEFGISYVDVFKKTFKQLGGEIVACENFSPGETDFRTALSKIKPTNPEGLYILSYANNIGLIPRQARELGIKSVFFSTGIISQDFVIKQAGGAVEGTYFTTAGFDVSNPSTPELKHFVTSFKEKYNKAPVYWEVFGYDSVYLIAEAIKRGGGTSMGIQKGLKTIKDFKGAAGKITVSEKGEVNFPIVVKKIINGKLSSPLATFSP